MRNPYGNSQTSRLFLLHPWYTRVSAKRKPVHLLCLVFGLDKDEADLPCPKAAGRFADGGCSPNLTGDCAFGRFAKHELL